MRLDLKDRHVNLDSGMVVLDSGASVQLTEMECRLLRIFAERPGVTISRDELTREVWGTPTGSANALTMTIRRLRAKVEPDPSRPDVLVSSYGRGYQLRLNTTEAPHQRTELALLEALRFAAPGLAAGIAIALVARDGALSPAIGVVDSLLSAAQGVDRAALLFVRARAYLQADQFELARPDLVAAQAELAAHSDVGMLAFLVEESTIACEVGALRFDRLARRSGADGLQKRIRALLGLPQAAYELRATARLLGNLGVTCAWVGRHTDAADAYRRAAEYAARAGDVKSQYTSAYNVAVQLKEAMLLDEAEAQIRHVLPVARQQGQETHVEALRELSDIAHQRGDLDEAHRHASLALEILGASSPDFRALLIQHDLAAINLESGRFESAEPLLAQLLSAFERGAAPVIGVASHQSLGLLRFMTGDGVAALSHFETSEVLAAHNRLVHFEYVAHAYIGAINASMGLCDEASKRLEHMRRLERDRGPEILDSAAAVGRLLRDVVRRVCNFPGSDDISSFELMNRSRADSDFRSAVRFVEEVMRRTRAFERMEPS